MKMSNGIFSASFALLLLPASLWAASRSLPPLETVPYVDISRYLGTWYEIARLPHWFERNCEAATANYSALGDGKLRVVNSCHSGSVEGKLKTSRGTARIVDTESNAKLKVTFFWPFAGDYWILELGQDYEYAVVGTPDRKSFWILSRTPELSDDLVEEILGRFSAKGFDFAHLERAD